MPAPLPRQCDTTRGQVRCQRDHGHDGHHRAEVGAGNSNYVLDWAATTTPRGTR